MTFSDRREFLKKTGLAVGAFATGTTGLACASSGIPRMNAEVAGSVIRFETAIPELSEPGAGVMLESAFLEYPILLIKGSGGSFTALSTQCTHLGCEVRKEPTLLRCPCHDSAYNFSGEVLNGPAEIPLDRYSVVLTGTIAEIHLQS